MGRSDIVVAIAGALIGLGGAAAMLEGPILYPGHEALIFWGGVGVLSVGGIMLLWALFHSRDEQSTVAEDFSIKTGDIFGSFNRVGHTFNAAPVQRTMDDNLRAQILKELPRDKPITVTDLMGDTESMTLANEVYSFLKAQGFLLGDQYTSMFGQPIRGLVIRKRPDGTGIDLIVGSR